MQCKIAMDEEINTKYYICSYYTNWASAINWLGKLQNAIINNFDQVKLNTKVMQYSIIIITI